MIGDSCKLSYVVIRINEDGEKYIEILSSVDLRERLNEHYWGEDIEFGNEETDLEDFVGLIIIRGVIVQPWAKKTVIRWEI